MLMMVVAVTAALLACTKDGRENENDDVEIEPQYAGADTMTLRVVDDGEDGTLILAGETEVYTLPLDGLTLYLDGSSMDAAEIESGMTAEVWYTGGVQETYPAKFSQVVAVSLSREDDARYDLCGLYLQVLEDLWATAPALNDGVAQLGLDLSQTRLSPAEQGAVGVALSWQRDCPVLTGTWEALADQGYIDRERVEWDDGLFLSLAEENPSGALTFTAQKWRSGTGAYWFTHCTARQNPSGHWDGYTVGGEAIS